MLEIHFAPLQGYTDNVYRCIHNRFADGVDCYYTPFVRIEKDAVRNKDLRDINSDNNRDICVVPQIIAGNRDEFSRLCDIVQKRGWKRIDFNMGCPFPMQTKFGRGSGLLQHKNEAEQIFAEMQARSEVNFSIKMRTGFENADEGLGILEMLNDLKLSHITLHPRLGILQYKENADLEIFAKFYEKCRLPMIYNGDIVSVTQIENLEKQFPELSGVMIGRGLLARPTLANEYKQGKEFSANERLKIVMQMHENYYAQAHEFFRGDSQILTRMHIFWEFQNEILPKKIYKRLMKCGNLKNYELAVEEAKKQELE